MAFTYHGDRPTQVRGSVKHLTCDIADECFVPHDDALAPHEALAKWYVQRRPFMSPYALEKLVTQMIVTMMNFLEFANASTTHELVITEHDFWDLSFQKADQAGSYNLRFRHDTDTAAGFTIPCADPHFMSNVEEVTHRAAVANWFIDDGFRHLRLYPSSTLRT